MKASFMRLWRWWRQTFARHELLRRLVTCTPRAAPAQGSGLVMIQIDALSRRQFDAALDAGEMPFLRTMLRDRGYRLYSHYSGMPSTTPAVQGEILYGVRAAVPAFEYYDAECGERVSMLEPHAARAVELRLAHAHRGALAGGSVYAGIYGGSAAETHFCASDLQPARLWRPANPLVLAATFLLYFPSFVRIVLLAFVELLVAQYDALRGWWQARYLWDELKMTYVRAGVCVALREWSTLGVMIDAARGLPVIQVTYLGYDEQAHHRGPASRYAHWSLQGIDGCIRRIYNAAQRSNPGCYRFLIYSDHGQEAVRFYEEETGDDLGAAIEGALNGAVAGTRPFRLDTRNERAERLAGLAFIGLRRMAEHLRGPRLAAQRGLRVCAQGPLGHVYCQPPLDDSARTRCAEALVYAARVPLVLAVVNGEVHAWNTAGAHRLPSDAAAIFGKDHPFLANVARDMADVVRHEDAGELVLSGWRTDNPPLTFARERGAHGGPGYEETHGFALMHPAIALPEDADVVPSEGSPPNRVESSMAHAPAGENVSPLPGGVLRPEILYTVARAHAGDREDTC